MCYIFIVNIIINDVIFFIEESIYIKNLIKYFIINEIIYLI